MNLNRTSKPKSQFELTGIAATMSGAWDTNIPADQWVKDACLVPAKAALATICCDDFGALVTEGHNIDWGRKSGKKYEGK